MRNDKNEKRQIHADVIENDEESDTNENEDMKLDVS